MSLVFKLYRLQQVDTQLDAGLGRLREIEIALSDDSELRAAMESAQSADQDLETARKNLKRAEESTRSQRSKIDQSEKTLYSGEVKNPKELQDLQMEVAALKRYLSVLEDRQLESMLELDDASAIWEQANSILQETQARKQGERDILIEEQSRLEKEVEHLQIERQAASSGIPTAILSQYETLRTQRQGMAVARVTDKTCSACGSTLSSALLGEARSPNQLARCGFCGRILYAS